MQLRHRAPTSSSTTDGTDQQQPETGNRGDTALPSTQLDPKQPSARRYSPLRVAAGWLVHFYTATGVLVNFYSLLHAFILAADFQLFAQLNWLAIFIDATDGTMARAVDVHNVVPQYDGALLDNIIDFMTFSVLPALAIVRFNLVSDASTQALLCFCVLIGSAYAFCQTAAKTSEAFVGFPSYWNVVVFYLYYLDASYAVTVSITVACALLSFVPIHFIYPTKTKAYNRITLAGAYIWGILMVFPCVMPEHPMVKPVLNVSLLYVVYYIGMSLYLDYRRRKVSTP